ncbi:alpha/beta hydrolase [Chryseosolibacter indicus]|uniref:Dienelactone hydrolase family protein n=1 Tax=Chryseosolibacter indicus TaxID=2782351 RepID=A0ABS5VVC3_9BACT|nr:dienelactone hydrolase family protein [Chryseosolibacter indicus]MBT1703951.1 dienelactone hydrolase family protein [Chryseosolibacter indicus]
MHKKEIVIAGKSINNAKKALIMLHGRGATAEDIIGLSSHLNIKDYAIIAPQATNYTWYPYSFLAPPSQNEPWLSGAITLLSEIVSDINASGIASENIYFAGFSQGACLTLEFVTRNARKWGGAVAFTGGLIGDKIYTENYKGDFEGTPVFIGTSDPDMHVPVERVYASTNILKSMNASVTEKVYANMGHTIIPDEIENANKLVFS